MLAIDYRSEDRRALLHWTDVDASEDWVEVVRRLILDVTEDAIQESPFTLSLPWWNFVAVRNRFSEVCRGFGLTLNRNLFVGAGASELLQQSRRAANSYLSATQIQLISAEVITSRLMALGFARTLTDRQTENVGRIAALSAAATFSVPGAGKTTEALATFFLRAGTDERLLVIAPKNAFAAWDEQLTDCMPQLQSRFVRLRSGKEKIAALLELDPRFTLITYQQLARVPNLIAAHLAKFKTHVFLDESHRIKSGVGKQTARAVLGLAHLPVGKLIMSGTPASPTSDVKHSSGGGTW